MMDYTEKEKLNRLIEQSDVFILQPGTDTCMPCASIRRKIDEWNSRFPEVQTCYVSLEDHPEEAAEYGIFSVPAILVFVQGKLTIKESGYFSLEEVLLRTERYIDLLK